MGGNAVSKIAPVVGTIIGAVVGGGTTFGTGTAAGAEAGAAIGAAVGGGVGVATARPPRLAVPPPVTQPDPAAIEKAQRESLAAQFARRGRASTILTGQAGDKLG
jgi:hypothetical protein